MKDKTLLNESTIRRFMKLASLEPIAETFVSSRFQPVEEEEELEEMGSPAYARDEEEELPPGPEGAEGLGPEMEPEMEPEMGDEEGAGAPEDKIAQLVQGIADAVEQVFPEVEMNVSSGEGEEGLEPEMEPEMGGEEGLEPEMGDEGDMGMEDEGPMMEEDVDDADLEEARQKRERDRSVGAEDRAKADVEKAELEKEKKLAKVAEQRDAMVSELAERISARLQGMKSTKTKKENLAEALTQRIFKRLSKKS